MNIDCYRAMREPVGKSKRQSHAALPMQTPLQIANRRLLPADCGGVLSQAQF
jgi:hypothetical protein